MVACEKVSFEAAPGKAFLGRLDAAKFAKKGSQFWARFR